MLRVWASVCCQWSLEKLWSLKLSNTLNMGVLSGFVALSFDFDLSRIVHSLSIPLTVARFEIQAVGSGPTVQDSCALWRSAWPRRQHNQHRWARIAYMLDVSMWSALHMHRELWSCNFCTTDNLSDLVWICVCASMCMCVCMCVCVHVCVCLICNVVNNLTMFLCCVVLTATRWIFPWGP